LISIVASTTAPAVDDGKTTAAGAQAGSALTAGVEVVLKSSGTPLSDAGRLVPSQDRLTFVIERVQGDLILLASSDQTVRGWLHPDNVVPLDKAVGYFAEAIAGDRRNAELYWTRGRLLHYLNEDARAIANLNQAIRLKPDQARLYLTRSLVYIRLNQVDRAMEDCDKAIRLDPKSPRGYQYRASVWLRKNDPGRAGADLGLALQLDPTNPIGPERAAPAAAEPEEPEPGGIGEPAPQRSAEPQTAVDFVARGDERAAQKQYDRAIADYTSALKLDPKYAPAYIARGRAWANRHYREKEIADCSEAIKLEPGNAMYWLARAESWSIQGMHNHAMADYAEALKLEPKNPAIWLSRGNEWRHELKLDLAIADFTYATQLDPKYIPAYVARANTWKQRKDFDRAIQQFNVLIQFDPESALAHWSLARILATTTEDRYRNGKSAVELATRASELTHWRDPDCLDTLAAAYAEVGDFAAAIKWQNEAIKLINQNVPSVLQKRAQSFGGMKGLGFVDRLAYYKSQKPTRE
jgi:tetratricopeptide (TPR) repeat protein